MLGKKYRVEQRKNLPGGKANKWGASRKFMRGLLRYLWGSLKQRGAKRGKRKTWGNKKVRRGAMDEHPIPG